MIPAFNEAANLPHVLPLVPEDVEVILVDGCSTDGTVAVTRALRPDATILRQNRRGRGNALACGFSAATGEIIVTLDGDGSVDPGELPLFIEALVSGADVAQGSRFRAGGRSEDVTRPRAWGDRLLNRLAAVLFRTGRTDLCYGYSAIWAHCLPALRIDLCDSAPDTVTVGDGFDFAAVLEARAAKAGLSVVEVASVAQPRKWGESNRNAWRDGARILRALLLERITATGRPHQVRH